MPIGLGPMIDSEKHKNRDFSHFALIDALGVRSLPANFLEGQTFAFSMKMLRSVYAELFEESTWKTSIA